MAGSILDDTKKALNLESDYTPFDQEIIMHINSVLASLHQLGIGPAAGYAIVTSADTWDEFIGDELRLNNVQTYVFLRVKMIFDPPPTTEAIGAFERQIEQAEWRLTVAQDEIVNPLPPPVEPPPVVDPPHPEQLPVFPE